MPAASPRHRDRRDQHHHQHAERQRAEPAEERAFLPAEQQPPERQPHGRLRAEDYRLPVSEAEARGTLAGRGRQLHLNIFVAADGLIAYLSISALPTSWAELDRRLAAVAPRASFLAAQLDQAGDCQPEHRLAAGTARPLNSEDNFFAVAEAIAAIARITGGPTGRRDHRQDGSPP